MELLKSCIQRQPSGPPSVDTVMIRGADHMYSGEEEQVARTIATWADNQLLPIRRTEGMEGKRQRSFVTAGDAMTGPSLLL